MNKCKKVLIVMPTAFRFGWMGATQRLFQLATAFNSIGLDVAVLAGKTTNLITQPEIDEQFPGIVYRSHHSGAYPRLLDCGMLPRRICRAFWKLFGPEYYAAQVSYGWAKYLNVVRIIGALEKKCFKPDIIWGVSTGYLEGPFAAQRLSEALGIPWIIELHDPPHGAGIGQNRNAVCNEFERLLRSSSRQVVTSDAYRKNLIERFSLNEIYIHTIHLSYEGEICDRVNKPQQLPFRILYAGNLGAGRSLKPLVYALHLAISREPSLFGAFLVDLVGEGEGFIETEQLADSLKIGQLFHFHGRRLKIYCEDLSSRANLLVLVQTKETCIMQIPGKLFTSLKYAKPILAIMPESEGADILRSSGLGYVNPPDDVDGIAKTLTQLCQNTCDGKDSVQINYEYITEFSSSRLPDKLYLVTKDLIDLRRLRYKVMKE